MKRSGFYGFVLIPLALTIVLVLWLGATQNGLVAIFGMVNRFTPVTITHQGLQGKLADFQAEDLIITLEAATITVHSLSVRWSPLALLDKQLTVATLRAAQVDVESSSQAVAAPETPFDIDAIGLPIGVDVQDLVIARIDVNGHVLRAVAMQAVLVRDHWQIRSLNANTDYGELRLTTDIKPEENWTHAINLNVKHESHGPMTLAVTGDRSATNIAFEVAALAAKATLRIVNPLTEAQWEFAGTAEDLSGFERSGHVRISGQGDLTEGALKLDALIDDVEARLRQIGLRRVDDSVDVSLDGRVQDLPVTFTGVFSQSELRNGRLNVGQYRVSPDMLMRDARIDIGGEWAALRIVLEANGEFPHSVAPLAVEPNAAKTGSAKPGPVQLGMRGTLQDFRQLTMTDINARLLAGKIRGSGAVSLVDSGPSAVVDLDFVGLNLASINTRLPTAVSGRTNVRLKGGSLEARVTGIKAVIAGNVVAVTGAGGFALSGGELTAAQLTLNADKDNKIFLGLTKDLAGLDVDIDIGSLAAFIPGARGVARGRVTVNRSDFSVQGNVKFDDIDIPGVMSVTTASLEGSDVQYGSSSKGSLEVGSLGVGSLRTGSSPADASLSFTGQGLALGPQQIESFDVAAVGSINAHKIKGTVQWANDQRLQISVAGGLDDRDWRFAINDVRLTYDGLSAQLEAPASGHLSPESRALEPLCLIMEAGGKACASLNHTPGFLAVAATVSLPAGKTGLEVWLSQFGLPAFRIDEGLDIQFDLQRSNGIVDRIELSGLLPQIVVPVPQGEPVEISDIRLAASGTGQAVEYVASLKLAGGTIASNGELADLAMPKISGNLVIDLPDLPALSALMSDLDVQRGALNGNVSVRGTLSQPLLSGTLDVSDLQLEWPVMGTRHEGQLSVVFNDSRSGVIEGELRSTDGVAKVNGEMNWQPAPGAIIRLAGENFLLADTADLGIAASPDLVLRWQPGSYNLTGSIVIDRAYSTLDMPALQDTVVISKDVVFTDELGTSQNHSADQITVDVVASFSKPGKIDGRGISGEVDGRVRITQQPGKPALANGSLKLTGTYRAFGQTLTINSGQLVYTNTSVDDPAISAFATRTIDDVTVGVRINGRIAALTTALESTPEMSEADKLHYLVLGRAPGTASETENNQLSAAAISLALSQSQSGVQSLGERIGVTDLGITQELGMLALAVGKQISPRLYISYTVGLLEPVDIARMRYKLNRFLFLEAEVADESRAGINYRIEKD